MVTAGRRIGLGGERMIRTTRALLGALLMLILAATAVAAGSPHFIRSDTTVTIVGNQLTVSIAGLGDEEQVHIVLTVEAQCINSSSKHSRAANKELLRRRRLPGRTGRPSSNSPSRRRSSPTAPPMTLDFISVTLEDTTNGISLTINV